MAANGDTPHKVRSVHVVNGVATSVSGDGTTCMMQFKDVNGEDFALTFPVQGLGRVRAMLADLMRAVDRHDAGALGVPIRPIKTIQVERNNAKRGHVLVIIDSNLPEETAFALPDTVAHQVFSEGCKQAAAGMTPEQRVKATLPTRGLILPGR